jgi:hypothetical protein
VLLKFILGSAFHLSPKQKAMCVLYNYYHSRGFGIARTC